jgi:CDP-glucose 4,6-dehydratase
VTPAFWTGRRVLVTGHTGFKGAWLSAWLDRLGARVSGLALAPDTGPNLWDLLGLGGRMRTAIADINDRTALAAALDDGPEVVFHMAAQSLVRRSYREPVETFATNVVGVVSLLDAIRRTPSVSAVVIATSDKCYENLERDAPYREGDRLGGRDPYSASKGCAEIAAASMRQSFFTPGERRGHPAGVATVRAGNVIGGGDWSEDRLVPDIVRGCLGPAACVELRAPGSIRPWQHVLEPLRGYLMLAERLSAEPAAYSEGWNFGPGRADERTVGEVAEGMVARLGRGRIVHTGDAGAPHEAKILRLDAGLAARRLGWRPVLGFGDALTLTADWYADWSAGRPAAAITAAQIEAYMDRVVRAEVA